MQSRFAPAPPQQHRPPPAVVTALKLSPAQRQRLYGNRLCVAIIVQLFGRLHVSSDAVRHWVLEGRRPHPCLTDARRAGWPKSLPALQHHRSWCLAHSDNTVSHITGPANKRKQEPVSSNTARCALKASRGPLPWVPINRGRVLRATNKQIRLKLCRSHKSSHC